MSLPACFSMSKLKLKRTKRRFSEFDQMTVQGRALSLGVLAAHSVHKKHTAVACSGRRERKGEKVKKVSGARLDFRRRSLLVSFPGQKLEDCSARLGQS